MNIHDMTEVAYKNGYEAGKKEAQAEIEKLTVELVGMRGACESYKMHYENAQAEIERLQEETKKQKAILEAINDEINPLPFETDFDRAMKKSKSEAIKEFAAELYNSLRQYENYDTHHTYEILDRIESVEEFLCNNLVKEMTEKGGVQE